MKGFYWIEKYGIGLNEGGTPINLTILWGGRQRGFYLYFFGRRFYRFWRVK